MEVRHHLSCLVTLVCSTLVSAHSSHLNSKTNYHTVGYMAAGWKGSEGHAPGFPKDGSWVVKHEGLLKGL